MAGIGVLYTRCVCRGTSCGALTRPILFAGGDEKGCQPAKSSLSSQFGSELEGKPHVIAVRQDKEVINVWLDFREDMLKNLRDSRWSTYNGSSQSR